MPNPLNRAWCCVQGHGRSAVTAAAILVALGEAHSADEALALVGWPACLAMPALPRTPFQRSHSPALPAPPPLQTVKARPGVKPNYRQVAMLREWVATHQAKQAQQQ